MSLEYNHIQFTASMKLILFLDDELFSDNLTVPLAKHLSKEDQGESDDGIFYLDYNTFSAQSKMIICEHITQVLFNVKECAKEGGNRQNLLKSEFQVDLASGKVSFDTIFELNIKASELDKLLSMEFCDGYFSRGDDSIKLNEISTIIPSIKYRIQVDISLNAESVVEKNLSL